MKSWDELKALRERVRQDTRVRDDSPNRVVLAVGMATCGIAAGARETMAALNQAVAESGLDQISVTATGCFGMCWAEPMVEVRLPNAPPIRYGHVNPDLARRIVREHVGQGNLIGEAIVAREG